MLIDAKYHHHSYICLNKSVMNWLEENHITRLSQKFCNILVTWDTIWQLLMLWPRLWRWWTTLNCEIHSSSDTLQVLLTKFFFMVLSTALESTVLALPDLAWSSRFLQPEQNFLNHPFTVLWSTAPWPFMQQIFLIAFVALWLSLNA